METSAYRPPYWYLEHQHGGRKSQVVPEVTWVQAKKKWKNEKNERNTLGENLQRVWNKDEGEWDLQTGR